MSKLKLGTKVFCSSIPGMDGEHEGEIVNVYHDGYGVKISGNFYGGTNSVTKYDTRTVWIDRKNVREIKPLRALSDLSTIEQKKLGAKYKREKTEKFKNDIITKGSDVEIFRLEFLKRNNIQP